VKIKGNAPISILFDWLLHMVDRTPIALVAAVELEPKCKILSGDKID
jgi:hypothetical protein